MAAGVPVVAAKIGGVPDLIEEGRTGLFCDPRDPASMRGAVARLLGDPVLGRQLAMEANARARERFHPAIVAQRHLEIYREVLSFQRLPPGGRF
jgi:glycosyltransferase involved in cell wall biosynthesis